MPEDYVVGLTIHKAAFPVVLGALMLCLIVVMTVFCISAAVRRKKRSSNTREDTLEPLLVSQSTVQGPAQSEQRNSEMTNTILTNSGVIEGLRSEGFHNPLYVTVDNHGIGKTFRSKRGMEESLYQYPDLDESALLQCGSRIRRDDIRLVSHLGSGQFGTVEKGVWTSSFGLKDVAVKTLNPGASSPDRIRFLKEAAIMGQFSNPNVVELHGIVTDGEPIMIVLELLPKRDLRNYLISMRPSFTEATPFGAPPTGLSAPPTDLSVCDTKLLEFCRQIASGMRYLADKGFVHRDLAARNILVSEDEQCKIADFGMSRDLYDEDYYVSHGGKIPVKWTAPEALYYKKYSTASDVWSFGCVMYEIWSLGHKPFEGYSNDKVLKLIEDSYRLPPPPGCPRAIYDLMIQCWHPSNSDRPNFMSVLKFLSSTELLRWSPEDRKIHPQATLLGAPLECGQDLYQDLQKKYL